jgi:hypothetical protein
LLGMFLECCCFPPVAGCSLLLAEYHGYGMSTGQPARVGMLSVLLEPPDVYAACRNLSCHSVTTATHESHAQDLRI